MSGEHTHAAHAFSAADTSHSAGDWAAAVEHYTEAAQFFKRGHMAAACHDRRGSCLAELDNMQEAIKCHTKAIELAPKMMSAWHNRGHAHMQLGDHESAIVDLETALRLDHSEETARLLEHATLELQCPPRATAAFEKALAAYGLSEWNAARLMFEEALVQRHTRPGRCLNGLALAYAGLGQLDHALQAVDQAIEAEPENPRAWHNRAQIKAKLGRDAEAQAEAMMAVMLSAKDPSGGHTGRTTVGHLLELREVHPENVALKAFDPAYFQKLELTQQNALIRNLRAVIENPGIRMACFACHSEDYERFQPFFQHVVTTYHEVPFDTVHTSDWSLQGLPDLPSSGVLDLVQFGLSPMPVQVRAARNLTGFPLPAVMSRNERCELENVLLEAFEQLIENPEYGGRYCSFTPGHSHAIPPAEYQALVKQRLAFQDMSGDKTLLSMGIASHWPYGRGVYISEDRGFVIWVGEQDHLCVICMEETTVLNRIFDRLYNGLQTVSALRGVQCAVSEQFGAITSCPTNVGTGLRASICMQVPNLSRDGTDIESARRIAATLDLSVHGVRGKGSAKAGKDGMVEISPTARFGATEAQILWSIYKGVEALQLAEEAAAEEAEKARRQRAHEKEMARHKKYMDEQYAEAMAEKHLAAIRIQARWRGIAVRVMVSRMVEDELEKAQRMQEERRKAAEKAAAEGAAAAAAVADAERLERLQLQESLQQEEPEKLAEEADREQRAAEEQRAAAAEKAERDRRATEEARAEEERAAAAEQTERDRRKADEEDQVAAAAAAESQRVQQENALAEQRELELEKERIRVEEQAAAEAEAARLQLEREAQIAAEAEAARLAAEEEETRERRRVAAEKQLAADEAARVAAAEAEARQSELHAKLEADARKAAEAEQLSAEQFHQKVQDELNAALTEDLPFGKNSGAMLDAGPQMLVGVAAVLQRHPYVSILVEGHSKGTKNTPFLQKLSEKRAMSVKNELVAQGVRPDHIKVKGSGADGRGGHVFITVSKIDLEAAGVARGLATPERSFAEHLDVITMSPEQQAKRALLDQKVKALRLRMMTMLAAKQHGLQGQVGGESEGSGDPQE